MRKFYAVANIKNSKKADSISFKFKPLLLGLSFFLLTITLPIKGWAAQYTNIKMSSTFIGAGTYCKNITASALSAVFTTCTTGGGGCATTVSVTWL